MKLSGIRTRQQSKVVGSLAVLVLALGGSLAAGDEPAPAVRRFDVQLVDADGKPVAGAEVGIFGAIGEYESIQELKAKDGTAWFYNQHARSGADGIAQMEDDDDYLSRLCLIARHEGRKIAAVASTDPPTLEEPIRLTLRRETELVAEANCKHWDDSNNPFPGVIVIVSAAGKRMLECTFETPRFRLPLPPGDYEFEAYGYGTHFVTKQVTVRSQEEPQSLEPIDLPATKLMLLAGQTAPEIPDVVAWKNSRPLKLADLRGKCVVLDFCLVSRIRG